MPCSARRFTFLASRPAPQRAFDIGELRRPNDMAARISTPSPDHPSRSCAPAEKGVLLYARRQVQSPRSAPHDAFRFDHLLPTISRTLRKGPREAEASNQHHTQPSLRPHIPRPSNVISGCQLRRIVLSLSRGSRETVERLIRDTFRQEQGRSQWGGSRPPQHTNSSFHTVTGRTNRRRRGGHGMAGLAAPWGILRADAELVSRPAHQVGRASLTSDQKTIDPSSMLFGAGLASSPIPRLPRSILPLDPGFPTTYHRPGDRRTRRVGPRQAETRIRALLFHINSSYTQTVFLFCSPRSTAFVGTLASLCFACLANPAALCFLSRLESHPLTIYTAHLSWSGIEAKTPQRCTKSTTFAAQSHRRHHNNLAHRAMILP